MPCNTSDMPLVHRVFRREFAAAPTYLRSVGEGSMGQAAVVADHLLMLLDVLHHHHETEDELIWPELRERAPDAVTLVDDMGAEHEQLAGHIERITTLLRDWRTTGSAVTGAGIAERFGAFVTTMTSHLDHEEHQTLPVCATAIDQDEWDQLAVVAMQAMGAATWLICVGAMAEAASEQEWEDFIGAVPPDVADAIRTQGIPAYTAHIGAVRAVTVPPRGT